MKDNKFFKILMIIFFPLFMLYCIGKNLFRDDILSFFGGVFLFVVGFLVGLFILRPDLVAPIIRFFGG